MKRIALITSLAFGLTVSAFAPVANAALQPNPGCYRCHVESDGFRGVSPNPLRWVKPGGIRYVKTDGIRHGASNPLNGIVQSR